MTHAPVFDARDPRASMEGGGRGRGKPIGKRSTRALRIDPLPDMNLVLCSRNQRHVEAINFFGKPTNRRRILLFSSPSSSFKLCTRVFVVFFSWKRREIFERFFWRRIEKLLLLWWYWRNCDLMKINCFKFFGRRGRRISGKLSKDGI